MPCYKGHITDKCLKILHLQVKAPSLHFHIPKKLIKAYRDAPEVSIAEASQSPIDRRVSVSGILQQVSNLFSISSNQRNSRPEQNYQKVRKF